jgi:hypothetical protein
MRERSEAHSLRPAPGRGSVGQLIVHGQDDRAGAAGRDGASATTYPGYRFPAEIISYAVWLYHVLGLSLRDGRTDLWRAVDQYGVVLDISCRIGGT